MQNVYFFQYVLKNETVEDLMGSKRVNVWLFYKFVFEVCLFIPYFVFQHSGKYNFKIKLLYIYAPDKGDEYYTKIN
jgi:hypothetical protein